LKFPKFLFLLLAVICLAAPPSLADLWVATPADGGSDVTGDGTEAAPYATIQFAYDQATRDPETIHVLPGTYDECLSLADPTQRSVNLLAEAFIQDPIPASRELTVIDGTGVCPALHSVINLGGYDSRIEGFTVTGGEDSAIWTVGSAVITNNVIRGNSSFAGGGIYSYPKSCYYYGDIITVISDNLIENNTVTFSDIYEKSGTGGGIFASAIAEEVTPNCFGGIPTITITNNVIQNNFTEFDGGGAFLYTDSYLAGSAEITVTENVITANQAGIGGSGGTIGFGGGIYATTYGFGTEMITVDDNTIFLNAATGYGGGMWGGVDVYVTGNQTLVVNDNRINENGAGTGGGLELIANVIDMEATQSANITMTANTVNGNIGQTPGELGGGAGLSAGFFSRRTTSPNMNFEVSGNTFRNNHADVDGGGVEIQVIADAENILDPNDTDILPSVAQIDFSNNLVALNDTSNNFNDAIGGGLLVFLQAFGESTATANLDLNTIADNTTQTGAAGVEVECYTGFDTGPGIEGLGLLNINSSIVYGNDGFGLGGPFLNAGVFQPAWNDPDNPNSVNLEISVTYSDFAGNTDDDFESWIGGQPTSPDAHNVFDDPLLDLVTYIPQECSPTIDGGDPIFPNALEPPPNRGIVNMGHTGGTAEAAPSLADPTGDNLVDGIDILRIAVAFGSAFGNTRYLPEADLTGDDAVDGDDLVFAATAFGTSCP
jgi:hypothetical protein